MSRFFMVHCVHYFGDYCVKSVYFNIETTGKQDNFSGECSL